MTIDGQSHATYVGVARTDSISLPGLFCSRASDKGVIKCWEYAGYDPEWLPPELNMIRVQYSERASISLERYPVSQLRKSTASTLRLPVGQVRTVIDGIDDHHQSVLPLSPDEWPAVLRDSVAKETRPSPWIRHSLLVVGIALVLVGALMGRSRS